MRNPILYKRVLSVLILQVSYVFRNRDDKEIYFGRVWWTLKKSVKILDAYSGMTDSIHRFCWYKLYLFTNSITVSVCLSCIMFTVHCRHQHCPRVCALSTDSSVHSTMYGEWYCLLSHIQLSLRETETKPVPVQSRHMCIAVFTSVCTSSCQGNTIVYRLSRVGIWALTRKLLSLCYVIRAHGIFRTKVMFSMVCILLLLQTIAGTWQA